jgi:hypothetical protein
VVQVIRELPQVRMGGVVHRLQPDFVVFRPGEVEEFVKHVPTTCTQYEKVDRVVAGVGHLLSYYGHGFYLGDREFSILRKREVATPSLTPLCPG